MGESLLLDATDEEIEVDAEAWRSVASATMEMDVRLDGFVPRVGDKVEFGTPLMSVVGTVSAVHVLAPDDDLGYALMQAVVRRIAITRSPGASAP